jgi:glycosyltransferase involved in cell wall biosynthesis
MLGQLKENQYDIWHFHDPDLLPLLVLWKWLLRRRAFLIYDAHEDVPKDILDKNWIPKWVRKPIAFLYGALERFGVKHCKVVIAATDSIHDHLKTKTGIVVTVHNYPIWGDIIPRPVTTDACVRVIYAGNITAIRGLREVVQAMNLIGDCNVELNLYGEMYPRKFAEEITATAGDHVKIWGKVSYSEAITAIHHSDIGIICFHPLPNHVEAMPNKLFEYLEAKR